MRVWVCTWEPEHTLQRTDRIRAAIATGLMRVFIREHGYGSELTTALQEAGLVSVIMRDGDAICPECDAFMDVVLSRERIEDPYDALVDVVQDFDIAIERTRRAKARSQF